LLLSLLIINSTNPQKIYALETVSIKGYTYVPVDFNPGHQSPDGVIEGWFLIIGINDYEDPITNIQGAVQSAERWYNFLKQKGYQSVSAPQYEILTDTRATSDNFWEFLEKLLAKEEPDDYVVFIFCGHGGYDPSDDVSYIILHDGWAVTSDELAEIFSTWLDSDHVFIYFEACQIGRMSKIAETRDEVYVAMASDTSHLAYSNYFPDVGDFMGVFTYYFLVRVLENDPDMALQDVFDEAKSLIINEWNTEHPDMEMNPIDADSTSAPLVLINVPVHYDYPPPPPSPY